MNSIIQESLVRIQQQCLEITNRFNKKNGLICLGITATTLAATCLLERIVQVDQSKSIDEVGQMIIDKLYDPLQFYSPKVDDMLAVLYNSCVSNQKVAKKLSTLDNFAKLLAAFKGAAEYSDHMIAQSAPITPREADQIFSSYIVEVYSKTNLLTLFLSNLKDEDLPLAIQSLSNLLNVITFPMMLTLLEAIAERVEPRMYLLYASSGLPVLLFSIVKHEYNGEFSRLKNLMVNIAHAVNNATDEQRSTIGKISLQVCMGYSSFGYYLHHLKPTKMTVLESITMGTGVAMGWISLPHLLFRGYKLYDTWTLASSKLSSHWSRTIMFSMLPATIISTIAVVLPPRVTAIYSTLTIFNTAVKYYNLQRNNKNLKKNYFYKYFITQLTSLQPTDQDNEYIASAVEDEEEVVEEQVKKEDQFVRLQRSLNKQLK